MKVFTLVCLMLGMLAVSPVLAGSCAGPAHTHDDKAGESTAAAPEGDAASTNDTEAAASGEAEKAE